MVTGASRGIGAATAKALDRAGARVAVTARSAKDLDSVAAELRHHPVVVAGDLRDPSAPAEVAGRALEAMGSVDVLVNNAAMAARLATVETDAELIDQLLAVNVRAPLLLVAALVPAMIGHGHGSIVNLSSVSGLVGTPRRAAYAASKGALDAATRSLAIELGPSGIRVNSVAQVSSTRHSGPTTGHCRGGGDHQWPNAAAKVGRSRRYRRRDRLPGVGCGPVRDRRDHFRGRRHGPHPRPLRGAGLSRPTRVRTAEPRPFRGDACDNGT